MTTCHCPRCGAIFAYEDDFEGRKIRCDQCAQAFVAPPNGSQGVIAEAHPSEPLTAASASGFSPAAADSVPPTNGAVAALAKPSGTSRTSPRRSRRKLALAAALVVLTAAAVWLICVQFKKPAKDSASLFDLPTAAAYAEVLVPDPARSALKPSIRVAHYDEALAKAKETGHDIVVFQRGSDWNRLSEALYQNVWLKEPFSQGLGNGYILVAVDNQESAGAPPVPMSFAATGDIRSGATFERDVPQTLLNEMTTGAKNAPPASEIIGVTSANGVPFERNPGGTFSVAGSLAAPRSAIIKLSLTPKSAGKYLRIDFPAGTPFVNKCAGLAPNGNFALTAVRVIAGEQAVEIAGFQASAGEGAWQASTLPCQASKAPGCWNAAAHHGQPRTLVATLTKELPAGSPITVEMCADTPFAEHIPGALRAALLADAAQAIQYATVPASELTAVASSDEKLTYARQADGTYLAQVAANPPKDTLLLKLKPESASRLLRLDFPLEDRVPNHGPGRAGNAVISELRVFAAGKPVRALHAWGSGGSVGNFAALTAIDGIVDKPGEGWNLSGGTKQARTLFVLLENAPPAGDLDVQLVCESQWNSHIPTRVRACLVNDDTIASAVASCSSAQAVAARNVSFTWNDPSHCPRIALLDNQGRAVACDNNPRISLTGAGMARKIHELRTIREQRDAIWAQAEKATGREKATLLVNGIRLLHRHIGDTAGVGMWDGNNHCYRTVLDEIEKADPKDESWASRIFRCGLDSRCGFALLDPKMRAAGAIDYFADAADAMKAKEYEKALAAYDAMIVHPNFKNLDPDLQQRVHLGKYNVYRSWPPDHQNEAVAVLKTIVKISGETTLGKGAIGLLDYTHRSEKPENFAYGWGGTQVKAGANAFEFIRGLDLTFTAPGSYVLTVTRAGGNGTVNIGKVSILDGDQTLAQAEPSDNELSATKPALHVPLKIPANLWRESGRQLRLRVDLTGVPVPNAATVDASASLAVQRVLEEVPAASAPTSSPGYAAILKEIEAVLANNQDVSDTKVQLALVRREWIRACNPAQLDALRLRPGGAALLDQYGQDRVWLEEFMTSSPPAGSYAIAMENMRVLCNHCKGLEIPVYQRLATAIALTGGNTSQLALVTGYQNYYQAHRSMRLYRDFETLDLRSLRGVIDLSPPEDFAYLLDERQVHPGSALGACNAIWYMSDSILGGSIFGGGYLGCFYHTPWAWCFPRAEIFRKTGGVCGTLSSYGSWVSRVNGIQSHNVGQPAHCAYVVRIGKAWHVGNYVSGPTGDGVPGWPGIGYNTSNTLQEEVLQDRAAVIAAARQTWLAHWQRDAAVPQLTLPREFKYALYESRSPSMPDFTKLKPAKTGVTAWPDPAQIAGDTPSAHDFAATWDGEIELAVESDLEVQVLSQDEAHVFLDGALVMGSNRNQALKTVHLKAGKHPLKIAFRHSAGRCAMDFSIKAMPVTPGQWGLAYEAAIQAQPKNYGVWYEYISAVKLKQADVALLKRLISEIAATFQDNQEAAWALIYQCVEPLKPVLKPEEMRELLLAAHKRLLYSNNYPHHGEGLNIGAIVAWQVASMPDPAMQLDFIQSVLATHFSDDPAKNSYFGGILGWANTAYGSNPAVSFAYTGMIKSAFSRLSSRLDKQVMRNVIDGGIRNASTKGDLPAYRMWMGMARQWLPAEDKRWDPALQAKLNADFAKPFPGQLLSPDGLLQSSSPSSVLAFDAMQRDGEGTFFYVGKMKNPWLTMQLGGESELNGIVLVGHLESFKTQLPLKVSISTDGQHWTAVATVAQYTPSIRVDLVGKGLKARFIRVERPAEAPDDYLHVRNFLVYGKRLY